MRYFLHGEESERLVFRAVSSDDFNAWLPFFQDPAASVHWIAERDSPEQECRKWYARQEIRYENDEGGMNALIERSSGRLVGHAGLLLQKVDGRKELEIAYSLLPAFWKKGYATEAALICRDRAFSKYFAESLISIISLSNKPSAAVARKLGMLPDGQTVYNGNDVAIFRIQKNDWLKMI